MKRKIIALLLLLIMVVSPTYGDVTPGEELRELGIISGDQYGNLNEDKELKRSEMAVIFSQLYGLKDLAEQYEVISSFSDVDRNIWYSPYISYAESQGWMIGGGPGSAFRPNDFMSAQEVNAALLKVLGHEVSWDSVNMVASNIGISVNSSTPSSVLRGEIFTSLQATLDKVPVGKVDQLGRLLKLKGYVYTEDLYPLSVVSIDATSKKSIDVSFNRPKYDEDITFLVKRLNTTQELTTSWNKDRRIATLSSRITLKEGSYVVSVIADNIVIAKDYISITDVEVDSIEILSNVVTIGVSRGYGYAAYKAYDQYGNDITHTTTAGNLTFYSPSGIASGLNGLITIVPDNTPLNQNNLITVVISAHSSGASTHATLPVNSLLGTLSSFGFDETDDVKLRDNALYYLPYIARDLSGNTTTDYEMIMEGLIFTSETNLVVSAPDYVSAKIIKDINNPETAVLQIKVVEEPYLPEDLPVTISVILYNGIISTTEITLLKNVEDD